MRKRDSKLLFWVVACLLQTCPCFAISILPGHAVDDIKVEERVSFNNAPAIIQLRTLVSIPQDFGKVIAVFADTGSTVFWFEAGDGRLRNVRIAGQDPTVIRRSGKAE